MIYYRVNYYRKRDWIDYKLVESELGETDAIRKTKLLYSKITEVFEISKEEFERYKQLQKQRKEREEEAKNNRFVTY